MKNFSPILPFLMYLAITLSSSCKKDFLEAKPSTRLLQLNSLEDYQKLLNNTDVLNTRGALPLISSDEYVISDYAVYQSLSSQVLKNAYLWQQDLYGGQARILDWNSPYAAIFYANSVLEGLETSPDLGSAEWKRTKGWAYFSRAYSYYDLAQNFCEGWDEATASSALGLPLKTKAGIDELKQRSNLAQTYELILTDLQQARNLLTNDAPTEYRNQPCKASAFALFARIYLSMCNYPKAEAYADSCLKIYDKLIDYNTVSTSATSPFTFSNDETMYNSLQVVDYGQVVTNTSGIYTIAPDLYASYASNDLRKAIYFRAAANGNIVMKRGYSGSANVFTGLATDEQYLIKAECAARRTALQTALTYLNSLLLKRYVSNSFLPIQSTDAKAVLDYVLLERRKELIKRGLRWSDLKRLNKAGAGIVLSRTLNGQTYTLPANDPKYIFPIPEDEIKWSGITQNPR